MDSVLIYKRVIGLDVHQAQITGCAMVGLADSSVTCERREFGGFKRDRKALVE
jgi:transposase